ncbi:MAG: DUF4956 domain-containing protein [Planctomycetota bacterium]
MPDFSRAFADFLTSLPSLAGVAFWLLLAFVLGKPLAWIYVRTHHGTSYSRSFVQSLVILPLIVTVVMLAIGDNMARAFGLFGALALIRFRTPIKDSRDAVFLFLAVATGITTGVQNAQLALLGTAFTLAVAAYLYGVGFGSRLDHDGVLHFSLPAAGEHDARLRDVLRHYCRHFALVSLRESRHEGVMDFAYQLHLRDPQSQQALVTDVRAIPGAQGVSLFLQNEHEEV